MAQSHSAWSSTRTIRLSLLLAILAAAPCVSRAQYTLQPQDVLVPRGHIGLADTTVTFQVRDGYKLSVYYTGTGDGALKKPRFMARLGADGPILVADPKAHAIFKLLNDDLDSVADTAVKIAPADDSTHSVQFADSTLYVSGSSMIHRYADLNHDGYFETEIPFISDIHSTGVYDHFTRTLLLDGESWLVGVGASCNVCREQHEDRGAILRYDRDGTNKRVVATGLRNPIGLCREYGGDSKLWLTNAERDGQGDDAPPEFASVFNEGDFFGWPFVDANGVWNDFTRGADYQGILPILPADSLLVSHRRTPTVTFPAHSTPMGIVSWPPPPRSSIEPHYSYVSGLAVALHGSSPNGRTVGTGYKVVIIPEWSTDAPVTDLVTGFLMDSIHYKYIGRPCGVLLYRESGYIVDPLLISSDAGVPAIYMLRYVGDLPPTGVPTLSRTIEFRIKPNPARTQATFTFAATANNSTLTIFDELGRVVHLASTVHQSINIDVSGFAKEVYTAVVSSGEAVMCRKLVVY